MKGMQQGNGNNYTCRPGSFCQELGSTVFFKFGLHCIGCHISAYESVEDGAKAHGVDPVELVKALNEAVELKEKDTKES